MTESTKPTDNELLKHIATAEHPLSTAEIAAAMEMPRTTCWDILKRLEDERRVESWSPTDSLRMWEVPGNFGDTSLKDVYRDTALSEYLDTGEFPAETDEDTVLGCIDEALLELVWQTPLNGGVRYDEIEKIAALFEMSVAEFMQLSLGDVYALLHDGAIHHIPKEGYQLPDGRVVDENAPEAFREKRKAAGVSQNAVAEMAGVHQPDVSKWERGNHTFDETTVQLLWGALRRKLEEKSESDGGEVAIHE